MTTLATFTSETLVPVQGHSREAVSLPWKSLPWGEGCGQGMRPPWAAAFQEVGVGPVPSAWHSGHTDSFLPLPVFLLRMCVMESVWPVAFFSQG